MMYDQLNEKAEFFTEELKQHVNFSGLIVPTLITTLDNSPENLHGNYENCAIWSGTFAAAMALKFSKLGDPTDRELAWSTIQSLFKLEEVTGEKGLIARGYKIADKASFDEELFWKKGSDSTRQQDEWHQNKDMRWLGDTSKSQVFGLTLAYFSYLKFCNPDSNEKKAMAENFTRVIDRIAANSGQIVDADRKLTGYGSYSPKVYFGFGGIGPALWLVNLKLAAELSGDEKYNSEYSRLINDENYLKYVVRCRISLPGLKKLSTAVGSEDNLAMLNLWILANLDLEENVQLACRSGVNKRWKVIDDPYNALFNFIHYAVARSDHLQLSKEDRCRIGEAKAALAEFPDQKKVPLIALKRKLSGSKLKIFANSLFSRELRMSERPIDEYAWRVNPWRRDEWEDGMKGEMKFTGIDYMMAYWLGRYYGYVK
jgi:hypothetical protein